VKFSERGAAMLAALAFLIIVSGITALMFTSTLSEIRHTGDDLAIVQALTLARGGINLGGRILQDAVRDELQVLTLREANTVERFPFGSALQISDPKPSANSVITDLNDVLTDLQARIDALLCSETLTLVNAQKVSVRVYVTAEACNDPLPTNATIKLPTARYISGQPRTYAVPFVLVANAEVGSSYKRSIAIQGEYQFTLGGGKFSQYAHFTNKRRESLWFTSDTIYDGRVHTNETFNLAYRPWFGAKVTSAGCTSVESAFDANGKPTTRCTSTMPGVNFHSDSAFRSADDIGDPPQSSNGQDKPQFIQGVDWKADYVPLPHDSLEQKLKAEAKGLKRDGDFYSLTLYAGDASGNYLSKDHNGDWQPAASHQYIELCKTVSSCERFRYGDNHKLYKQADDGTWPDSPELLEEDDFNGLIYINGKVERFKGPGRNPPDSEDSADAPPALAAFATLTVVPVNDVRITGDLTYEDPPCSGVLSREEDGAITRPSCDNLNTKNVLGVFSPEGNVIVGNKHDVDTTLNAPDNVTIHGSYMTAKGMFVTENLRNVWSARGDINVLGGIIQNEEGTTGRFQNGAIVDGYGMNITFDGRMALDYAPPYFPGTSPSDVQGIFVYSFGQREQVF